MDGVNLKELIEIGLYIVGGTGLAFFKKLQRDMNAAHKKIRFLLELANVSERTGMCNSCGVDPRDCNCRKA